MWCHARMFFISHFGGVGSISPGLGPTNEPRPVFSNVMSHVCSWPVGLVPLRGPLEVVVRTPVPPCCLPVVLMRGHVIGPCAVAELCCICFAPYRSGWSPSPWGPMVYLAFILPILSCRHSFIGLFPPFAHIPRMAWCSHVQLLPLSRPHQPSVCVTPPPFRIRVVPFRLFFISFSRGASVRFLQASVQRMSHGPSSRTLCPMCVPDLRRRSGPPPETPQRLCSDFKSTMLSQCVSCACLSSNLVWGCVLSLFSL